MFIPIKQKTLSNVGVSWATVFAQHYANFGPIMGRVIWVSERQDNMLY